MHRSCADGYAPLEQFTFPEASTKSMHDGSGVDYEHHSALPSSPEEDEALRLLIYMFLSHLDSLISSALLNKADLDGWDILRMSCAEKVPFG